MSKVNVVIPVFQKPEQVEKCLEHLKKQDFGESTIILEDNNEENRGFTKAVNHGIKTRDADCEYVVVLNQDCYLNKDAISKMVEFMDAHPDCFLGGIKQLHSDDTDVIIHGGCTQAYPHGRHLGGSVKQGHCNKDAKMPWVNGACMIVNCSEIETVGLMDENYFLVGSDSDWAYTARLRHLEVWYIADAIAIHEQGISAVNDDREFRWRMDMDMIYWRDKWLEGNEARELIMEIF
jgi:GT2 family glycosyltransferase